MKLLAKYQASTKQKNYVIKYILSMINLLCGILNNNIMKKTEVEFYELNEFDDWIMYMQNCSDYSLYELECFEEHYQNLLTFEENLENFLTYLKQ